MIEQGRVAMTGVAQIADLIRMDPVRWHLLSVVRDLRLPDCWIGAGFVRDAVWDHLHGRQPVPPSGDVDVIWHDGARAGRATDLELEATLHAATPGVVWSVKNQTRMHTRNLDPPYASATEAMRHWPETATAVAVRRTDQDMLEIAAPYGLDDLLSLILRPTPAFAHAKRSIYQERQRTRRWSERWPLLRQAAVSAPATPACASRQKP